jgi:TRAP-type mannitol/chloroaromatic compound transport system permease small subunit
VLSALSLLVRCVDRVNEVIGRAASWLTLGVVLVCFLVVVLRYAFSTGFVWLQDAYVWLHAAAFSLASGYALARDRHVRVDILYARMGERGQAWVNLLGVFFLLLPFVTVLVWWSWGWVARSWALAERSSNVGGLPGLYLVKSCLVAFAVLVGLQGLALAARSVLVLLGRKPPAQPAEG